MLVSLSATANALACSALTPWANTIMEAFRRTTSPQTLLTNIPDVAAYGRWIRRACEVTGLRAPYTPHSPRAGWATSMLVRGMAFGELQEKGRWVHPGSLRVYLDVVGAHALKLQEANVTEWAGYLDQDLLHRFPWWR